MNHAHALVQRLTDWLERPVTEQIALSQVLIVAWDGPIKIWVVITGAGCDRHPYRLTCTTSDGVQVQIWAWPGVDHAFAIIREHVQHVVQ